MRTASTSALDHIAWIIREDRAQLASGDLIASERERVRKRIEHFIAFHAVKSAASDEQMSLTTSMRDRQDNERYIDLSDCLLFPNELPLFQLLWNEAPKIKHYIDMTRCLGAKITVIWPVARLFYCLQIRPADLKDPILSKAYFTLDGAQLSRELAMTIVNHQSDRNLRDEFMRFVDAE